MATGKFSTTYVSHSLLLGSTGQNELNSRGHEPSQGKPRSSLGSKQVGVQACHLSGSFLTEQPHGGLRAGLRSRANSWLQLVLRFQILAGGKWATWFHPQDVSETRDERNCNWSCIPAPILTSWKRRTSHRGCLTEERASPGSGFNAHPVSTLLYKICSTQ